MAKLLHIQVLRAGAALSVAMLHAQSDAQMLAGRLGQAFTPSRLLPWTAGVDVFFVISGFIMVYASRRLFGRPGSWRTFLTRRLARVVPLYWAATTLYGALALARPGLLGGEGLGPGQVLASYLFIPMARDDGTVQPLYSLGWTLNYEVAFYAVFALGLAWDWRQAVPSLILGFGLAVTAGFILGAPPTLGALPTLGLQVAVGFWTDPIILEFAFGMALGLLRLEDLGAGRILRLGLALAGLGLLALDLLRPEAILPLPRVLAYGVPAALLVAAAILGRDADRPPGRLARFSGALGDASYALYLVHPFVIRGGREIAVASPFGSLLGPWGFVALALAAATAVALLVHRWFERPLTERLRQGAEGPDRPAG